jgi:hypothetical protein
VQCSTVSSKHVATYRIHSVFRLASVEKSPKRNAPRPLEQVHAFQAEHAFRSAHSRKPQFPKPTSSIAIRWIIFTYDPMCQILHIHHNLRPTSFQPLQRESSSCAVPLEAERPSQETTSKSSSASTCSTISKSSTTGSVLWKVLAAVFFG